MKNMPKLPDGWKEYKLSEITAEITETAGNKEYETLSISAGIGFVNQAKKFGKELSGNQYEKYIVLHKGDFSYNKGNSKKYPQGCIYQLKNRDAAAVPNVFESFRFKVGINDFFEQLFLFGFLNKQLFSKINHGVRDDGLLNLTGKDFYDCSIPFPPLPEQQKIAEILSTQDKIIELKEKLLEQKQEQKKSLMKKLFSPDGETFTLGGVVIDKKGWKKEKLGNICNTFSGGTPNRSHAEYFNGTIPWIKSGELNNGNIYSTEENLTELGLKNSSAKIVEKESLLIAMYGATAGVLATSYICAAINQAILALIPKIEIEKLYLKNTILNQIETYINKFTQGGQPNFNASIIGNFIVYLPSLPEQQAIAEVLSTADKEINLLKAEIDQEKLKKKALMQLLLTGIVRVKE